MKLTTFVQNRAIPPSELVLNADGSAYHIGLKPNELADTLLVVGDPGRVKLITSYFDEVDSETQNREFYSQTGTVGGKRITVLSTGIGVDNIDIVVNELDALRNIDLKTARVMDEKRPLDIIRIGTCGALHRDIEAGSFVHSQYALGLDGVLHFYHAPFDEEEIALSASFENHVDWSISGLRPYAVRNHPELGQLFQSDFYQGITATACGFYGPQGRVLRLPVAMPDLNEKMGTFEFRGLPLANYEMESSALFGLGAMLGHRCTTVCLVVANRVRNEFLTDYKPRMAELIETVLARL